MTRFHASVLFGFLLFPSIAAAQTAETISEDGRDASFLTAPPPAATPASPPLAVAPKEVPHAPPAPVVATPSTPAPSAPPPSPQPVDLGKPVEAAPLGEINPESIGFYSTTEGGLGAGMWKGTSRAIVEKLLPPLDLPASSPALNNLARRFLLTTASVPEGAASGGQSLTAMRVEKLVALGDAVNAWKLASLAKPDQIDEITLRRAAEAALLGSEADSVCAKLPDIMAKHTGGEWQKLLLVCQVRAKDTKATQLTFDLLNTQTGTKDEAYFSLVERNIIGGAKQLPRRLTPLKPLTLALLQLVDLPLPGEVYARPEAVLIQPLLRTKAKDDNARLSLAERAAENGQITSTDLAAAYSSITFTSEILGNAASSTESGPRLHALLYQAGLQEKTPQKRVDLAIKFLRSKSGKLNNVETQLLADMLGTLAVSGDFNTSSASLTQIYLASGKPDTAMEWLKQAHRAAAGMPAVEAELHKLWPLLVLAGLEASSDYSKNLGKWLDAALKAPGPDNRAQREDAASILLIFDAAGFAVPEDQWQKVMDVAPVEKRIMPPALLMERMRMAGAGEKRGEAVLLSLLLSSGNAADQNFLAMLKIIRALRLVGLNGDAMSVAQEAVTALHASLNAKP